MYSYEDRIRAVKLYLKLGKRIAAKLHSRTRPAVIPVGARTFNSH